jgi:hypothetical protein
MITLSLKNIYKLSILSRVKTEDKFLNSLLIHQLFAVSYIECFFILEVSIVEALKGLSNFVHFATIDDFLHNCNFNVDDS